MRLARLMLALLLPVMPVAAAEFEIVEDFGADPAQGYIGGSLVAGQEGPWVVRLGNGIAEFANADDPSALRFYDIVSVDDRPTDGASVFASVRSLDAPDGGAGILVGHPWDGDYLVFTVSGGNRFRVLQKQDGVLEVLTSGKTHAIVPQVFNQLHVDRTSGGFDFAINGEVVFRMAAPTPDLATAPVGIAAFGLGQFAFDTVGLAWSAETPSSAEQATVPATRCDLPPADPADLVALVGVYEGDAMANVSVAGLDAATSTMELAISPGNEPLYVIVNAYDPLIWRVTGAVERVRHLAVVGTGGVAGLPAETVSFHGTDTCFGYAYDSRTSEFQHNADIVAASTGVAPHLLIGAYSTGRLELPSGAIADLPAAGIEPDWDAEIVEEALGFTPAGVVTFDPATVLSAVPVETYNVLPQQFGLAQLVASGALVHTPGTDEYRIVQPIPRYPAGLNGAHSVTFSIEPGVPEPTGDPGHSEVIRLEAPAPDAGGA